MGHSPEQREQHPLCGAKKKNGETCRAFAGQGTEHFGTGKCRWHLGNTKNHKQAAVTTQAKARMVRLGMPMEVEPHQALLWLLHSGSGHCAWLMQEIAAMENVGGFEGQVLVHLYGEQREELRKVAETCLKAGAKEAELHLAERLGDAMATAFRSAFRAVPSLTEKQQRALVETFFLELAALEATGREPVVLPAGGNESGS